MPEVAAEEPLEVELVLDEDRLVEAELLGQRRDGLLGPLIAEQELRRVAGQQPDDEEGDHRDAKDL